MNIHVAQVDGSDRLHILLVDCNPVTLEKKALLLERFGCLVTCSTTGIEANVLVKEHPGVFDVVMADNSVPGMGGFKSETSGAGVPIVLYTDKNVFIDEELIAGIPSKMLN